MRTYSESEKSKLGNAIVYIAQRVPDLSKTKLLKLLYFMEEYSVRRFQTPFLGLTYEAWQAGPVPKDVFIDLSETPVLLQGYVSRIQEDNKTYISFLLGGYVTYHVYTNLRNGCIHKGDWGFYWTSTKDTTKEGDFYIYRKFAYNRKEICRQSMEPINQLLSVRYVRDASH